MRLWLGLLISLVLHAGLFFVPFRVHTAVEPTIEEPQLVLMPGGDEMSLQTASAPGRAAQPFADPAEPPPPTEKPKAIVIPKEILPANKPRQPDRRKKPVKDPPLEKPPQTDASAEVSPAQETPAQTTAASGSGSGPRGGGGGPIEAAFGSGNGPRFAHQVLPKYPRQARELGKEGTVH